MKGMPDSVVLGTIGHAKRRAVKRQIAARKGGRGRYDDLTLRDYIGGTILLIAVILVGAVIL